MQDKYVLGAYWGARAESIDQCARRLGIFLAGLADNHESLSIWYEALSSRKQSLLKPVQAPDTGTMIQLLNRGRNRENVEGKVMDDLGFQIGLWNGQAGAKRATLNIRCGLYWESSTPGVSVGNCVVLDLPQDLPTRVTSEKMSQILQVAVQAWDPAWAGIMSEQSMLTRGFDAQVPFVDWIVFLRRRILIVTPPSFTIELQERGSIVVVQPDPPSHDDPEALARIERVVKLI